MTIDNRNSRIYSRLGQRGAIFGMAVNDAAANDERFMLLTADLATLSGMDRYIKTYPNQFLNAGIAEQNMVGMAAGLAAEGFHPIVTTYATFLTMRACEQIRHYMGYMHQPIIAIGSGAGLSQGFAGNTHYTIEDLSMMRAIPGLTIYSPADAGAAVKIFEMALSKQEPTYIRLTGNLNCPIVYKEDVNFSKRGCVVCRGEEGSGQITIMACGLPIVSVDVRDVRERVEIRGKNEELLEGCYVAESREPKEIAELLEKALKFGKRTEGRRRIEEMGLRNEKVAKNLVEIYKNVKL